MAGLNLTASTASNSGTGTSIRTGMCIVLDYFAWPEKKNNNKRNDFLHNFIVGANKRDTRRNESQA